MIRKKICMLGAYAVGKTSLVRRFVEQRFSERYQTTIGVKILKKVVQLDDRSVNLLIWDLHGDDEFQSLRTSYLRGASGYFLVVDGTRAETLRRAEELHQRACEYLEDTPFLTLLNKVDLGGQWELEAEVEERLAQGGWSIRRTSAKNGEGVEEAFLELVRRMIEV